RRARPLARPHRPGPHRIGRRQQPGRRTGRGAGRRSGFVRRRRRREGARLTVAGQDRIEMSFSNNRLVPLLYGEHDANLARIEHQLGVSLASRGNYVTIKGPESAAEQAHLVLNTLWDRLEKGLTVGS